MSRDCIGYDDCISCIAEQAQDILREGMLNVDYVCPNLRLRAIEKNCSGHNCNFIINDLTPGPNRETLFCPNCWIAIYALRDIGMDESDAIGKIKSGIVEYI
jgi:hypothetical protein